MKPLNKNDIQGIVDLVHEYLGGMYRFSRKDYHLGPEKELSDVKTNNSIQISAHSTLQFDENLHSKEGWPDLLPSQNTEALPDNSTDEKINLDEIDEFLDREIDLKTRIQNYQSKGKK